MDRTYSSGAAGSAPAAPASPSSGYPTAGNPGTGTPATKPGPYWYHMIMEELMNIISAAGVVPAQGNLTQLLTAFRSAGVFQTAAQFDSSTKAATTAFVQRALGSCSGVLTISVSTGLSYLNAGNLLILNGVATTMTLPLTSACPSGSKLYFFATQAGITITRSGADQLNAGNSLINSVVMNVGDTLELTSTGASWVISGGSTSLQYAPGFLASLAAIGYQKLPSGLIVQWGSGATDASGNLVQSKAMTFPNTFYGSYVSVYGATTDTVAVVASDNASSITIKTLLGATGANSASCPVSWFSLGK